jgi:hypothetical protein
MQRQALQRFVARLGLFVVGLALRSRRGNWFKVVRALRIHAKQRRRRKEELSGNSNFWRRATACGQVAER